MKTLIVYKTVLGTSKQYAQWLSEALQCKVISSGDFKDKDVKEYGTLVLISGVYVGKIGLAGFIKKKWNILKDKKAILLCVGMAPLNSEFAKRSLVQIPENIKDFMKIFRLPGQIFGKHEPSVGPVTKQNLDEVISYLKI